MGERPTIEEDPIAGESKEKKMIKIICAWCEKDMGEKESLGSESTISHGICEECAKKVMDDLHKTSPN